MILTILRAYCNLPRLRSRRGSLGVLPLALFCWAVVPSCFCAVASERPAFPVIPPYEMDDAGQIHNEIDHLVAAELQNHRLTPANLCSDAVFIRRAYLRVTGTLPTPQAVNSFLADRRKDKRAKLIDQLLASQEFVDYLTLKWGDLLRVKAEFPINLWPNAVQAYHRWLHDAFRANMPYDQFVRELLTSSGSNYRQPQVNFYRGVQGRHPSAIAEAVALTFMGVRLEKWPEDSRCHFEAFFSRLRFKETAEWKEEIVYACPITNAPLDAVFPDGATVRIASGEDPRTTFAAWLTTSDNPWFKRNIVNRVWAWLLGSGIVHEPDDLRADNPPSHPQLLSYLENELVNSGYDLRHIYRIILNSRTFQQSPLPRRPHPDATRLFAHYAPRQLDAEVLIDALNRMSLRYDRYESVIPEPFTFIPATVSAVNLADGSITSSFLEMFGRPPRDTGLEAERRNQPTVGQRLHMLNSKHIQEKIAAMTPRFIARQSDRTSQINAIFLNVLARYPMPEEATEAEKYFAAPRLYSGRDDDAVSVNPRQAAIDLVWALVNTKEFLFN